MQLGMTGEACSLVEGRTGVVAFAVGSFEGVPVIDLVCV